MISGYRSALAYNIVSKPLSKLYSSVTVICFSFWQVPLLRRSRRGPEESAEGDDWGGQGEGDRSTQRERWVNQGDALVRICAKEKKRGALNGSVTTIEVKLLLDYVMHWLIGDRCSHGKGDRRTQRDRWVNQGDVLVWFCAVLIDRPRKREERWTGVWRQ